MTDQVQPSIVSEYECPQIGFNHLGRLTATVTKEEVWDELASMQPFKAPGLKGFQVIFFKTYWHIVGDKVWMLVKDAFATGTFDPVVSETLVALIPKVDVLATFRELRPISLCNVIYKVITKVLVRRLRHVCRR